MQHAYKSTQKTLAQCSLTNQTPKDRVFIGTSIQLLVTVMLCIQQQQNVEMIRRLKGVRNQTTKGRVFIGTSVQLFMTVMFYVQQQQNVNMRFNLFNDAEKYLLQPSLLSGYSFRKAWRETMKRLLMCVCLINNSMQAFPDYLHKCCWSSCVWYMTTKFIHSAMIVICCSYKLKIFLARI